MSGKTLFWLLGILFLSVIWVIDQLPDGKLHIVFCSVGQGDATLIVKNNFQMVVDGGPRGDKLLECLGNNLPFWDREIEVVLNTHPQRDHLGGLDDLLERFKVDRLIINGYFGGGDDADRMRELIVDREIEVVLPRKGDVIRYGALEFDILSPVKREGSSLAWRGGKSEDQVLGAYSGDDINDISVVGLLKMNKFSVLLTGDIGFDQESKLLKEGLLDSVDVLKVAHHGSRYSSGKEFLERVKPKVAVVEVGKNRFGHPTEETLGRLKDAGAEIYRTDKDGEIEIVSDGASWQVYKN